MPNATAHDAKARNGGLPRRASGAAWRTGSSSATRARRDVIRRGQPVYQLLGFGRLQPVAAEARQLEAAFDELDRKTVLDQPVVHRPGNVRLDRAVCIERAQPTQLVGA